MGTPFWVRLLGWLDTGINAGLSCMMDCCVTDETGEKPASTLRWKTGYPNFLQPSACFVGCTIVGFSGPANAFGMSSFVVSAEDAGILGGRSRCLLLLHLFIVGKLYILTPLILM